MMIIVISDVFRGCSRERFDFYGLGQVALPSSIQDNSLIQKLLVARMSIGSRINFIQDRKALFINGSPLVAMGAKVAMGAR